MTTQHTPGPLAVEAEPFGDNEYLTEVVVPGVAGQWGTSVATCHHNWRDAQRGERKISWAEAQANARLFSAAPELLEALELLRSFGCPHCNGDCGSANPPVTTCPMAVASAAIAKARGQ